MNTLMYRVFTFCFAIGMAWTLVGGSTGSYILSNPSTLLLYIGYMLLPAYFIWRHVDSIRKGTSFLPQALVEHPPKIFSFCMNVLWVIASAYVLTRLISLQGILAGGPGSAFAGLLAGGMLFMYISQFAMPTLFFMELFVWYYRGIEETGATSNAAGRQQPAAQGSEA